MESKKDDSLKRWDQSEINDRIWQYFNTHVSKKIIFDAINNKLSLEDLYFQLALARTKCEMIKQYVKEHNTANLSDEKLALLHTHLIESNDSNARDAGKFFTFHYEGGGEPLTTFESWGQRVEEFSRSRLNDPHNPKKRIIPGVSNFISFNNGWFWQTDLNHKPGFALDKADTDLQKMVQTTNLFEYFKISSHLVYALSNSPPTFRGSASISSWLMDYVGKNQFDFTQSIRPSLFDWAAFYESPEQYTSFFVISATVEYLKSLHVYPEIETFFEKMTFVLTKNPNENKEIQEREALWEELKSIIQIILTNQVRLANPTLSEKQINGLKELGSGHLEFRKISEQAIRISQLLATGMHVEEKNLDVLSPEDKEYFLQLNLLKWNASNDLLASFGNDIAEQQANLLWADAEYLATKFLLPDRCTSPDWRNTSQDPKTPISKAREEIYAKYIQGGKSRLISSGCVDPQNVGNYLSIEQFIESKGLLPNVCRALRNGLKLKELNEIFLLNILTKEQLELLTENAALLLYQNNYSVKKLIGNTKEETVNNIVRDIIQFHFQSSSNPEDLAAVSRYIEKFCPVNRSADLLKILQNYCVITKKTTLGKITSNAQNASIIYVKLVAVAREVLRSASLQSQQISGSSNYFFSIKSQRDTTLDLTLSYPPVENLHYSQDHKAA